MSGDKEHRFRKIAPSEIAEDPDRFQSRADYPRDTLESDLTDVRHYNEDLAGGHFRLARC